MSTTYLVHSVAENGVHFLVIHSHSAHNTFTVQVSSTELRAALKAGKRPSDDLLPRSVYELLVRSSGTGDRSNPPSTNGSTSSQLSTQPPQQVTTHFARDVQVTFAAPTIVLMRHATRLDALPNADWLDRLERPYDTPVADLELPRAVASEQVCTT